MSSLRLDALREKLLRAGIAPRHVRSYLGELSQHFDDLLRAETANGLSGEAAFRAARARLGSDDELAAAMLAQPELRSISARFPWAVFGLAPAVSLGLLIVAAVFVEIGVMKIAHQTGLPLGCDSPAAAPSCATGIKSFVSAWDWAMMYLLPLIVAGTVFCLGARQFISMRWLVPGALLAALLGTAVTATTILSNVPHKSEFSVGFGYDSDIVWPRIVANIAAVCAMSAFYWLWQRRVVSDQSSA